ncbi:MAG: hypothetical protein ACP5PB_07070 [Acidimicrobiales bacterium]
MNDGSDDEREILRTTPVDVVLGNHILHLLQLAAIHLAAEPPQLPAAQVTIDVVAAMIAAGGERLGEHRDLYRQALAEAQQVYVRAASGPALAPPTSDSTAPD